MGRWIRFIATALITLIPLGAQQSTVIDAESSAFTARRCPASKADTLSRTRPRRPVHDPDPHAWADSSADQDNPAVTRHGGLTDFGKQVVAEKNRLGMMVDISHVADQIDHAVKGGHRRGRPGQ